MCLIIERQPNFEIPYDKFESAIINNPDGFGLAYPDDGELRVIRSHREPDPEKLYRLINEELKEVPLSVHLRFTTAGATNLRNAHPFPILEKNRDGIDLRMAHNGTLNKWKMRANGDDSDTRAFVKGFVRPLFKRLARGMSPEELISDEFVKELLEEQLSAASVLSFIDGNGNTLTCNETGNGGKREEGWWYSNTYSFNPKHRVNPTTTTTPGPKVVGGTSTSSQGTTGAGVFADCCTPKFTGKFGLEVDDLFNLSDETIEEICKFKYDAGLLIKELLCELQISKEKKVVH